MRGNSPTVENIELDLEPLVLPANLLSNESLSSDEELEEERDYSPFQIDSYCHSCQRRVRVCVVARAGAIQSLEVHLLSNNLSFLCASCSKTILQHGRNV
ncbi:transforming protein [human papillomavirus 137]|uniref:Protein E7 n=1 Tax=human papillomavirus 137 TaxID=1070410 RepID=I3P6L8_9PAPI|nr:transforming protein [human papillomavirus 137]AEM24608.1 transforming protein [human papillomavirus 137]